MRGLELVPGRWGEGGLGTAPIPRGGAPALRGTGQQHTPAAALRGLCLRRYSTHASFKPHRPRLRRAARGAGNLPAASRLPLPASHCVLAKRQPGRPLPALPPAPARPAPPPARRQSVGFASTPLAAAARRSWQEQAARRSSRARGGAADSQRRAAGALAFVCARARRRSPFYFDLSAFFRRPPLIRKQQHGEPQGVLHCGSSLQQQAGRAPAGSARPAREVSSATICSCAQPPGCSPPPSNVDAQPAANAHGAGCSRRACPSAAPSQQRLLRAGVP